MSENVPEHTAMQPQIDDLQARVAFQEDALHVLSEQLAVQAEALQLAREHIHLLNQKLNELLTQADDKNGYPRDERPPHY